MSEQSEWAGERGPIEGGRMMLMDSTPVTVAVVTNRIEAELIVGMLRSHGMRAALVADDAGGQEPQLQMSGVRVLVAREDEAEARRQIAARNE